MKQETDKPGGPVIDLMLFNSNMCKELGADKMGHGELAYEIGHVIQPHLSDANKTFCGIVETLDSFPKFYEGHGVANVTAEEVSTVVANLFYACREDCWTDLLLTMAEPFLVLDCPREYGRIVNEVPAMVLSGMFQAFGVQSGDNWPYWDKSAHSRFISALGAILKTQIRASAGCSESAERLARTNNGKMPDAVEAAARVYFGELSSRLYGKAELVETLIADVAGHYRQVNLDFPIPTSAAKCWKYPEIAFRIFRAAKRAQLDWLPQERMFELKTGPEPKPAIE